MRVDHGLILLDSETGLQRLVPTAGTALDRPLHDLAVPGDRAYHLFLDDDVVRRDAEVQRRGTSHRPEWIVRCQADAGRLGHRRNLLALPQPTGVADVWLRDIEGTRAQRRFELAATHQPFTRSDGDRRAARDFGETTDILGWHWLFGKHDARRCDGVDVVERRVHRRRPAVEVHHDVDAGADSVAQITHHPRDAVDVGGARHVVAVGNADDLERVIALLCHRSRMFDDLGGAVGLVHGAHVAEAEVRVGPQVLAHGAPRQLPHWHTQVLAQDVPKRDLDAADRRHPDDAHAPEAVLGHDLEAMLDVERVLADQHLLDIRDGADHRLGLELERRFAPADQAGNVRLDAHEDPVALLRVADPRCDRPNSQASPP